MPRPRKETTKLSELEMRELIKDYNICFRGQLSPSQWPSGHPEIFTRIRQIRLVEFDDFGPEERALNDLSVNERKNCAYKLAKAASRDVKMRVKEIGWRVVTEPMVFERFASAMKCHTCSNFLWFSEFSALPDDLAEAERLQRRRARRTLCQCPPKERLWENSDLESADTEPGHTILFEAALQQHVQYDPADGLEKRHAPKREPDRVYGLARTPSLDLYTKSGFLRDLRHSPFSNIDLLYPFIICEAKSESGGTGFESINAQTAFPIRTCLKLQEDLCQRTGVPLKPLVWFLSYQGDLWNVAACTVQSNQYQVIDLWMGRASSLDGALQLLLIIDLICVWARDIFRFEISCCLAGGRENLRRATHRVASPAATYASRFSTQEPQFEGSSGASPHGSRRGRSASIAETEVDAVDFVDTASITDLRLGDSVMETDEALGENDRAETHDESIESYGDMQSHQLLKWAALSRNPDRWTSYATIRHSNMCLFAFSQLALPPDLKSLWACLQQISRLQYSSIPKLAQSLAVRFTDPSQPRNTTRQCILQLKHDWLRENQSVLDSAEAPLRALFIFRTYIRTSDWQIIRELWCITCSSEALHSLVKVAGLSESVLRKRIEQSAERYTFPEPGFKMLRDLTGHEAASAAINSKFLYYFAGRGSGEPGTFNSAWQTSLASKSTHELFSLLAPTFGQGGKALRWMERRTALMEIFRKPSPEDLSDPLGPQIPATNGAILLHKGPHWPKATPRWCLLILDELEFEEGDELAQRLWCQARYQAFDFMVNQDQAGEPTAKTLGSTGDEEFLEAWVNELYTGEFLSSS